MRETWVPFLGWEDPLEEGVATQSNILAWGIPMNKGAWWATWGHKEPDTTEQLSIAHCKINSHKQILRPEIMLIIHLAEQDVLSKETKFHLKLFSELQLWVMDCDI